MNKIRDLIYNISDILVTLVIITAALVLIGWRVSAIMDYGNSGSSLSSDLQDVIASQISSLTGSDSEDSGEPDAGADDETSEGNSTGTDSGDSDNAGENGNGASEDETPQDPTQNTASAAARSFTVNSSQSAESIAASLESAGLIPDQKTFLDAVYAADVDTKLKAGTFSIPEGASSEQIIEILTK